MTRRRRIIYNSDAGDLMPELNPRVNEGPEGFLSERFKPCVGTQVDSYVWCVGDGQVPLWNREVPKAVGDPHRVQIDAAREAGMEIFASLRMNDVHDAAQPEFTYPLKRQRPDLLLGTRQDYTNCGRTDAAMRRFWGGLNYAEPEVRDHKFDFIHTLCRKYDFDGLELDFFRHPMFFKYGEVEQNLQIMTDFVTRVRDDLNDIARSRGQPFLLAVHLPPTPQISMHIGLDVERWLVDALVDVMVVGGGYCPGEARYDEFLELGRRYGVPVYPCINLRTQRLVVDLPIERMRALAMNFWSMGADGVYLFNMFNFGFKGMLSTDESLVCLDQMGSPQTLAELDKLYATDRMPLSFPGYAYASWPSQLPAPVNFWVPIKLRIGDPVENEARRGQIKDLTVRVLVSGLGESENVGLIVNGTSLPITGRVAVDAQNRYWFEAPSGAPPLHAGINEFVVGPSTGAWGRRDTQVEEVQVRVRYHAR